MGAGTSLIFSLISRWKLEMESTMSRESPLAQSSRTSFTSFPSVPSSHSLSWTQRRKMGRRLLPIRSTLIFSSTS